MLMGKKMILAVFIIPFASGTKTKLQIIAIFFRSPADRAFMLGHVLRLAHLLFVDLFAANLSGRNSLIIPCTEKENQKIQKRRQNRHPACPVADDKRKYHPDSVHNSQPFRLKGNDEIESEFHIWKNNCKCQKQRHRHIFCAEIISDSHNRYPRRNSINHIQKERAQNRTEQPAKQVNIVTEGSDRLFNGCADKVIAGQEKDQK